MKKATNLFIGILCTILAVILVLLSFQIVGDTSSSYLTTATQYGVVETITPYKLTEEVKISFLNSSTASSSGNTVYVSSGYTSSSGKNYKMKIENADKITDYFDVALTSSDTDPSDFIDYYGVTKSSNSYGTLKDTVNGVSYSEPLHTEWSVGSLNASITSLNIASFTSDIAVTIYTGVSSTYDKKTLFDFNGEEIYYESESVKTDDVNYYSSGVAGNYTYTAGTESTKVKTYELYTYKTVVSKETAINIQTATNSQTEIFLIVLSPITGVSVADGSGNTSSYVSEDETISLSAKVSAPNGYTVPEGTWSSSDTNVATVSAGTQNTEATVTAVSTGITQITYTVCGVVGVYTVYVKGLTLDSSGGTIGVGYSKQLTATYIGDDSMTDVTSSATWTTTDDTVASVSSSGVVKGEAVGTATITATYSGSSATYSATIKEATAINITQLVTDGTLSTGTISSNTELYSDGNGTTVTVTSGSKTVSVDEDSSTREIDGYAFTNRLKLGGEGSDEYRSIKLELTGACYITVYAMSASSSSDTRNLTLYDEDYTSLDQTFEVDNSIASNTYEVSSSGTYYLGSEANGINIYCIVIMYKNTAAISGNQATYVGGTTTLTASVNGAAPIGTVTWSSSNADVATVSDGGVVTGVSAGTATITATTTVDGEKVTATCTVTVEEAASAAVVENAGSSTEITGGTYTVDTGEQNATVSVTNKTSEQQTYLVTATSSDSSVVTVSSVNKSDANALTAASTASCTIEIDSGSSDTLLVSLTPQAVGTATITITVADSGGTVTYATTTYSVTVQDVLAISGNSSVTVNGTTPLTATANAGTMGTVTWSVIDGTNYVSIDDSSTGEVTVTGKAVGGPATIQASASVTIGDSTKTYTATYTITVVNSENVISFTSSGSSSSYVSASNNNYSNIYGTVTYNGEQYSYCLKMESTTTITISGIGNNATIKLYFATSQSSPTVKVGSTTTDITESSTLTYVCDASNTDYTLKSLELTYTSGDTITLTKGTSDTQLFLIVIS